MQIIRFQVKGEVKYGELIGSQIKELQGDLYGEMAHTGSVFDQDEVVTLSPVDPGKIICVGLNYKDHAAEKGREIPEEPMIFMVAPSSVIAHEMDIQLPYDHFTEHEAELVIVMKKDCRDVTQEDALDYVLGYTVGNDVSDRDLQAKDKQFTRAKSFHTFKPVGPVIATGLDPDNLEIALTVNGVTKQKSNTNQFIFDTRRLISDISKVMTLNPGDVIFTGTPDGVSPIQEGDVIEVTIEGIGTLRNKVTQKLN